MDIVSIHCAWWPYFVNRKGSYYKSMTILCLRSVTFLTPTIGVHRDSDKCVCGFFMSAFNSYVDAHVYFFYYPAWLAVWINESGYLLRISKDVWLHTLALTRDTVSWFSRLLAGSGFSPITEFRGNIAWWSKTLFLGSIISAKIIWHPKTTNSPFDNYNCFQGQ